MAWDKLTVGDVFKKVLIKHNKFFTIRKKNVFEYVQGSWCPIFCECAILQQICILQKPCWFLLSSILELLSNCKPNTREQQLQYAVVIATDFFYKIAFILANSWYGPYKMSSFLLQSPYKWSSIRWDFQEVSVFGICTEQLSSKELGGIYYW